MTVSHVFKMTVKETDCTIMLDDDRGCAVLTLPWPSEYQRQYFKDMALACNSHAPLIEALKKVRAEAGVCNNFHSITKIVDEALKQAGAS